jgi:hypothetical protein
LVEGADLDAVVARLASSTVVRHVAERALDDRRFGSRRNVAGSATDA